MGVGGSRERAGAEGADVGETPPKAGVRPLSPDILDTPHAGGAVIRGSVLRAAAYAAGLLVSTAAAVVLIRHLGVADYGRFLTVVSLVVVVAGVIEPGLSAIGVREYARRTGRDRQRAMRNLLGVRLALTLAGVAAGIVFALVAYDEILVAGVALSGISLLLNALASIYAVALASALRLGWLAAVDVARQLASAVVVLALVATGAPLLAFFFVLIAANAVELAVTTWRTRGAIPRLPGFAVHEWSRILRHALPFAAATAIGVIYFRITIILMSVIAPTEETGYFSASFRVVEILGGLAWILVSSAFPVVARAGASDPERLRYALQRQFDVAVLVGAWMALTTAIGAGFIIAVIAGPAFDPSIPVLRIQALALLATFLVATWGYALLSLERYATLLVANAVALAVAVSVALVLVPRQGAVGGAIATLAAEASLAITYVFVLMRLRPELRVSLGVFPPVLVAVAAGAGVALALPVHDLARAVAATVIYAATVLALGAVPKEIQAALREWRARPG